MGLKEKWQARILNVELISLLLTPGVIWRVKGSGENLALEGVLSGRSYLLPLLWPVTFLLNILIKYLQDFLSVWVVCMFNLDIFFKD